LKLLCEEIGTQEYLRKEYSLKLLNQNGESIPFELLAEKNHGYAVEFKIELKKRGLLQFVVEHGQQKAISVWFKAGSYNSQIRKEYRHLERVKTLKCSLNAIKSEELKKKLKSLAAAFSRARYWASLAANAIALFNLENSKDVNVTEVFFSHILKILGKRKMNKSKWAKESAEWKKKIEELKIPMDEACNDLSIIKDIARQMHANFQVHIQRLKERLAYNIKNVKGIWFSNSLAENILNGEKPLCDEVKKILFFLVCFKIDFFII